MEQVLHQLPGGWEWRKLKSITTKIGSGSTPKGGEKAYKPIGISLIRSLNVHDCTFKKKRLAFIDDEQANALKNVIVESGDVLLNITGASIARCCIVPDEYLPARVNQHVMIIRPTPKIDNLFLNYLIVNPKFKAQLLWQGAGGATRQALTKTMVEELDIPLPNIQEQKRIVEKLDVLLSRIDTAIEHLQGKLELSKQLFDSVLDDFFKRTNCNAKPLTEVVNFIGGSQPPKSQFSHEKIEGYVRLIQIRDYKSDKHIVYVDKESTKKFCTKEDVMIGRYGPPVFQILRGLDGAYNVALMKAVPDEEVLDKDYLYWFLQSPSIQNYVIGISQRAAGQSGVNKKALEKYLIPVPCKDEQHEIVFNVEKLVSQNISLKNEVSEEISSLSQLKESILDSAFKGEL
ncbi:restriction endonuclease subunit S [Pseudoalteromonas nigrifaciens]|uniref:restriction endonuclease subunit S n=1 Tax=Pseudoalteromonas nigrifaciens TaxID=28109 RepID=UPI00186800E8|nr:restriction endonuclease subunit S [Pseudoalteromonas nigrifaciens]